MKKYSVTLLLLNLVSIYFDNISPEKCKQVVKDILFISKCKVCFNTLQPPVLVCINGHGFCEKCLPKPLKCRLCLEQGLNNFDYNELLNSIVDILPHKCRNDGCSVFVTSGDDHEERCGYKLTTRDAAKSKRADSGQAIEHITQDHKANPIDNISPEKCKQVVTDILSKTRCTVCSNILQPPVLVCINGHGFCEKCLPTPLKCQICLEQGFNCLLPYNVLLNIIVDLLPHKCRYDGCSVFVTSRDDHEERCGYKLKTHDAAKSERADSGQAIEQIIQDHEANPIDTLTSEDLKNLYENILKIINCPVCYNSLRPPVAMCENGHSTCPDCKANISACPLCNKPFLSVKNRQLDEVLKVIPHLCRFEGCQVFVKMDDDHETWCGYRKTDCKINACSWEGCVRGLAEHCKKDHKPKLIKEKNENWYYMNIDPCKASYDVHRPILAYGKLFWVHITNDYTKQIFKIAYYCVPDEKTVDSFQITFILKKDNKKCSTSILMLPENSRNEDENCICLHSSFVQTFVNSERQLLFSLHIEKK